MIPETLEELETANPVFLEELYKYGKVLFAKLPLEVYSKPVKLKAFSIISYDISGLSSRDKMRVIYVLYRKGDEGAVAKTGEIKLSEGCILIPSDVDDEIIEKLSAFGVNAKKLETHVSEDQLSKWLNQRQNAT